MEYVHRIAWNMNPISFLAFVVCVCAVLGRPRARPGFVRDVNSRARRFMGPVLRPRVRSRLIIEGT